MKFLHVKYLGLIFILFVARGLVAQDSQLVYPYEVKRAKLEGDINLAYVEKGNGAETLLFVHGLGSYLRVWQPNLDSLSKQFRCIALDLPGYGLSSKGDYAYDMSFYSTVLINFIEKLDLQSVNLVGHSMGGQIAMTLALEKPEFLKRLILVAPAGLETFSADQAELLKNFTSPEHIRNTSETKIKANLAQGFYQTPEEAKFMVEDRINMRQARDFDTYATAVSKSVSGMLAEPVFDRLGDIVLPVLILFGEEDALIPNRYFNNSTTTEKLAQQAVAKMPKAQMKMISEAGHLVQFEKYEEVNQAILKFLMGS